MKKLGISLFLLCACLALSVCASAVTWTGYVYLDYYGNGGLFSTGACVYKQTLTGSCSTGGINYIGGTVPNIAPVWEGHVFEGWAMLNHNSSMDWTTSRMYLDKSDVRYRPGSAIGSTTNGARYDVLACWTENTYAMSFYSAGELWTSGSKRYTLRYKLPSETPTRDGYDFLGWDTDPAAATAAYAPEQLYAVNQDTRFYAVWDPHPYDVSFDDNGGKDGPGSLSKLHGDGMKVPAQMPARSGYQFLGWSESADAIDAQYAVGDALPDRALALYAVWRCVLPARSVTIDGVARSEGNQTIFEDVFVNTGGGIRYFDYCISYPALLSYKEIAVNRFSGDIYAAERRIGDQKLLELTGVSSEDYATDGTRLLCRLKFTVESDNAHAFGSYQIAVGSQSFSMDAESNRIDPIYTGSRSFEYLPYLARALRIADVGSVSTATRLQPEFTPANTTNQTLIWAVDQPEIATVDSSGLLTPLKNGSVRVSAQTTDGSQLSDSITLNITGQKAALQGLTTDRGSWSDAFRPGLYEYIVYLKPSVTQISMQANFSAGALLCEGYGYCSSGVAKTFDLPESGLLSVRLLYNRAGYDETCYTVSFLRRSRSDCPVTPDQLEIHLPEGATRVEASAFCASGITGVDCGDRLTFIGSRAFADCADLSYVYLSACVADIAEDAFASSPQVILVVGRDSYAEAYAMRHGLEYYYREG